MLWIIISFWQITDARNLSHEQNVTVNGDDAACEWFLFTTDFHLDIWFEHFRDGETIPLCRATLCIVVAQQYTMLRDTMEWFHHHENVQIIYLNENLL